MMYLPKGTHSDLCSRYHFILNGHIPSNFITEGETYQNNYGLIQSGLFSVQKLSIRVWEDRSIMFQGVKNESKNK